MGRFGNGDLLARTEQYSLQAIQRFRHLCDLKHKESWIIGRQYFRSATSVGANLAEADAAETRKDFIHKCGIAVKESRECRYWVRLMRIAELVKPKQFNLLADETEQIISVLVTIVVNAKKQTRLISAFLLSTFLFL